MLQLPTLGWREWVALPELGTAMIRCKIDTGARSSALHVDWSEVFERDGQEWVRFKFESGKPKLASYTAEARIIDRRMVTDSGGHCSQRLFIRTAIALAGQQWPIEINLTDRRTMKFPMLLGRTAIQARFTVDPSRSFVSGAADL